MFSSSAGSICRQFIPLLLHPQPRSSSHAVDVVPLPYVSNVSASWLHSSTIYILWCHFKNLWNLLFCHVHRRVRILRDGHSSLHLQHRGIFYEGVTTPQMAVWQFLSICDNDTRRLARSQFICDSCSRR